MADLWNWREASRCRTADAEELFVTGAAQREARTFCRACPVRTECLAHALDEGIEFGWEHHPQVIIGKAAIEVTQDVGEKAIGLGKDTLDAGEDLYNRAKDLLPFG